MLASTNIQWWGGVGWIQGGLGPREFSLQERKVHLFTGVKNENSVGAAN